MSEPQSIGDILPNILAEIGARVTAHGTEQKQQASDFEQQASDAEPSFAVAGWQEGEAHIRFHLR